MPYGCNVFTSNVDGQFQKAGFDPADIHECHGSIHHLQCLGPCSQAIWGADAEVPLNTAQPSPGMVPSWAALAMSISPPGGTGSMM